MATDRDRHRRAARMSTYRRTLPPPTAFELLRSAREARWRQQEAFHRARVALWSPPNEPGRLPSILKRVALRAKTGRSRRAR
jgi:hypothetical protein